MKFVAPHEVRGTTTIRVYDFNPLSIKRNGVATAASSESDESTSYITMATTLDTSDAFKDIIKTSLPYRTRTLSLETTGPDGGEFGAVMCSEDNIIVVGVRCFISKVILRLVLNPVLSCRLALVIGSSVYSRSELGMTVSSTGPNLPGSREYEAKCVQLLMRSESREQPGLEVNGLFD
jgi:hypothetical protein